MKRLVVYKSSTGFTAKYATWIAEALSCEAKELKRVSAQEVAQYDSIIFGGWIMGGMINGLDKMRKMNPRKLIVFAVGAAPDHEELQERIQSQNHLEQTSFYYFEGGFDFENMKFFPKLMIKMLRKSIAKKTEKTEQDKEMEKVLAGSFDHTDKAKIEPFVTLLKEEKGEM